MKKIESLPLGPQDIGTRLDVFLHTRFPEFSRSFFAKHITNGTITVSQKSKKPSYLLKEGDCVFVSPSLLVPPSLSLIPNSSLEIPVLFEDERLLVIDKPAGIQVHPSNTENKNTVVNWLVGKYPELVSVGEDPLRPGIVHRLDKDTSGVLIIAKTQESFLALKELFAQRKMKKEYIAIVYGTPNPASGTIDKPIARSASFRKQVVPDARTKYKGLLREAVTDYEVAEIFRQMSNVKCQMSMITASPHTGRMHQIRVHLASIGHPVIGDKLYTRKEFKDAPSAPRQLLHAHSITFTLLGKKYTFTAEIPQDFQNFIHPLEKD